MMAEPAQHGTDDGPRQDWGEHVRVYGQFTHLTFMSTMALIVFMMCLAIGAIGGAWITTVIGIVLLGVVAFFSLTNTNASWRRFAALGVFILLLYAVFGW